MKFFIKKNKNPLMTIISVVPGIDIDPLVKPEASSRFLPDWWKHIPSNAQVPNESFAHLTSQTAKKCPSFAHWFSQGVILRAWCDISLKYNKEDNMFIWTAGKEGSPYRVDWHDNNQFIDHVEFNFQGQTAKFIFKLDCPWRIITPKGWSVYQLPLFYHFNKQWTILPGIIDTDVHHEINQQVAYFPEGETILIPKGTPLVQYIPFERKKNTFQVRYRSAEDAYLLESRWVQLRSKWRKGYLEAIKYEDERESLMEEDTK